MFDLKSESFVVYLDWIWTPLILKRHKQSSFQLSSISTPLPPTLRTVHLCFSSFPGVGVAVSPSLQFSNPNFSSPRHFSFPFHPIYAPAALPTFFPIPTGCNPTLPKTPLSFPSRLCLPTHQFRYPTQSAPSFPTSFNSFVHLPFYHFTMLYGCPICILFELHLFSFFSFFCHSLVQVLVGFIAIRFRFVTGKLDSIEVSSCIIIWCYIIVLG